MTHFTSQDSAARILNGWRHEILNQQTPSEELGPKELTLRLYSRYGMNDPTEHLHEPRKAGSRSEDDSSHNRLVFPDTAFVYCGSKELGNEALDRLEMWRAYGADGKGIAITTIWSKKGLADDRLGILEVEYIEKNKIPDLISEYENLQKKIDKAINDNHTEKVKRLHKKRMKLEVGYKGSDYKSEDEVRIVYYAGDQSNEVSHSLNFSAESGRLRAYIERKVKVGMGQTLSGLYVTVGPRVEEHDASHWKMMADWTIRQLGLSSSRWTCKSELKYVG